MSIDPAHPSAPAPIALFDSGIGGLTVLQAVRRRLPAESLLYLADTLHMPYGEKSADWIVARSLALCELLLARGAKAIVVACNTATSAAAVTLRQRFAVPIIALEPAIKPAAALTRSGVIGVLATPATAEGTRLAGLIAQHAQGHRVLVQPCPGLVEAIESNQSRALIRALLAERIAPLLDAGIDTLVLGCTHYPLVAEEIRALVGPDVVLLDTAEAVARELERRLSQERLLRVDARDSGELALHTSGDPLRLQQQLRHWMADLGDAMVVESASLDLPADRSPITRSL
ncbi:MAG TPA: glutamate racemase [Pseudomonadales bacterium]|nr:glutamate racemase [Pseudomonadales bacterium]HMY96811.1 glutamate racemase [Pseudomonadales bacterium]